MPTPHQIRKVFEEHHFIANQLFETSEKQISRVIDMVLDSLQKGKKLLLMGNGGSAADAQHLAAEFTGRFVAERRALPAIALTTDTSALTAIGNDYGFEQVFARQIEAIGQAGDLVIGISTSGNSPNILAAMQQARVMGITRVGFTGKDGGKLPAHCDTCIVVPSETTARIQEMHILLGHLICEAVDQWALSTLDMSS